MVSKMPARLSLSSQLHTARAARVPRACSPAVCSSIAAMAQNLLATICQPHCPILPTSETISLPTPDPPSRAGSSRMSSPRRRPASARPSRILLAISIGDRLVDGDRTAVSAGTGLVAFPRQTCTFSWTCPSKVCNRGLRGQETIRQSRHRQRAMLEMARWAVPGTM